MPYMARRVSAALYSLSAMVLFLDNWQYVDHHQNDIDVIQGEDSFMCLYCRMPGGQGLHKTARPPGRDKTRSVNPLVRTQVD